MPSEKGSSQVYRKGIATRPWVSMAPWRSSSSFITASPSWKPKGASPKPGLEGTDKARDPALDGVITPAAVRDEGPPVHYTPVEYPAVADRHVVAALADAAKKLGYNFAEGITQSKDSFYGQHEPENMPAESRLKERWEAWRRGNVMTSEMESAAIFVISSIRGCRASSIMAYSDMRRSVEVACEALRILIEQDKQK